jgi:hypothetical protein
VRLESHGHKLAEIPEELNTKSNLLGSQGSLSDEIPVKTQSTKASGRIQLATVLVYCYNYHTWLLGGDLQ